MYIPCLSRQGRYIRRVRSEWEANEEFFRPGYEYLALVQRVHQGAQSSGTALPTRDLLRGNKQNKQNKHSFLVLACFGSVLLHFALGNSQMSLVFSCLFLFLEFYWSHWSHSLGAAPIFREVSLQVTDCEQGLFRQSLDAPKLQQLRKDAGDSLGCARSIFGSAVIALLHFPTDSNCFGFDVLACVPWHYGNGINCCSVPDIRTRWTLSCFRYGRVCVANFPSPTCAGVAQWGATWRWFSWRERIGLESTAMKYA